MAAQFNLQCTLYERRKILKMRGCKKTMKRHDKMQISPLKKTEPEF